MRSKLNIGIGLVLVFLVTSAVPDVANAQRYRDYERYDRGDSDYCHDLARDYARDAGAFDGGVVRGSLEGAIKGAIVGRALGGKRGAKRGMRAGRALGAIGAGKRKTERRERVYRREYDRCMRY